MKPTQPANVPLRRSGSWIGARLAWGGHEPQTSAGSHCRFLPMSPGFAATLRRPSSSIPMRSRSIEGASPIGRLHRWRWASRRSTNCVGISGCRCHLPARHSGGDQQPRYPRVLSGSHELNHPRAVWTPLALAEPADDYATRIMPGSLEHAEVKKLLGEIAELRGDRAGAERQAREALVLLEGSAPGTLALASALERAGDCREVVARWTQRKRTTVAPW